MLYHTRPYDPLLQSKVYISVYSLVSSLVVTMNGSVGALTVLDLVPRPRKVRAVPIASLGWRPAKPTCKETPCVTNAWQDASCQA